MKTPSYTIIILGLGLLIATLCSLCLSAPLPSGGRPQQIALLTGHIGGANGLAFSPNGQTLASAGCDGTLRLWDVANGKNTATFKHPSSLRDVPADVLAVAFSPNGRTVASSSLVEIRLRDTITGINTETSGSSENLLFSPDGKKLVVTQERIVWDLETKERKGIILEKTTNFGHPVAAFDTKGKLLIAYIDMSAELRPLGSIFILLDGDTGKKIMTFKGHTGMILSLAFSPDRKILASGSDDKTVRLWAVDSGKNTATLKDLPGYPFGLAFSPDGKVLACGCMLQGRDGRKPRRGAVRLYETGTSKILATLKGSDPDPSALLLLAQMASYWLRAVSINTLPSGACPDAMRRTSKLRKIMDIPPPKTRRPRAPAMDL